ncbi:hypothetical protein I6I99_05105 [Sphingobacterium multivorum]|uniref:Bacteriocin n=1 Tax=Sphingobacterium multivorum TaxID=28454 RepID=A0ABX7CLA8_SPHMU|nr:hypothetical protein [Sphingobacterium multivorum]QQT31949.1 hypothetical protein I6I99_05105 [Sphingobacterium multivorum]QQT52120.1 hypothetical protein I6I98_17820 [Sphingobacterium multivorum]
MNKLDLKSFGAQDLSVNEMSTIDGGGFIGDFFLGKVADLIVDSIGYSMNNPEPGWNSTPFGHYGGARP